ncbi:MAG: hypothetical protein JWR13_6080 [Mycobacterium sp.]|jgi:hypothetical protein|nr:hypothetical protein [Mycobacterium sp.]
MVIPGDSHLSVQEISRNAHIWDGLRASINGTGRGEIGWISDRYERKTLVNSSVSGC